MVLGGGGNVRTQNRRFWQKLFGSRPTYRQTVKICSDGVENSAKYFRSLCRVRSALCTKSLLHGSLGPWCAFKTTYIRTVVHPTRNVWTPRPTSARSPATFVRIPTDIVGVWDQNLFGLPDQPRPLYSGVLDHSDHQRPLLAHVTAV